MEAGIKEAKGIFASRHLPTRHQDSSSLYRPLPPRAYTGPMADLDTLGDRLRRRRQALGIRSQNVAHQLRVSQNYVWLIEKAREPRPREQGRPSRPVLVRWATALGADRDELREWLTLADYDPTLTEDEMAMVAGRTPDYRSLAPEHDRRMERTGPVVDFDALRLLQGRRMKTKAPRVRPSGAAPRGTTKVCTADLRAVKTNAHLTMLATL